MSVDAKFAVGERVAVCSHIAPASGVVGTEPDSLGRVAVLLDKFDQWVVYHQARLGKEEPCPS